MVTAHADAHARVPSESGQSLAPVESQTVWALDISRTRGHHDWKPMTDQPMKLK